MPHHGAVDEDIEQNPPESNTPEQPTAESPTPPPEHRVIESRGVQVVRRDPSRPVPTPARLWPVAVATLRARLPELARNPAVVAAAAAVGTTLATSVATGLVRQVLRSGALQGGAAAAPTAVSGYLVAHVHVVHHHVVRHVTSRALPPADPWA